MYMTYPNANPTASITDIITDHTGSATFSWARSSKFIYQMVPSAASYICGLPTFLGQEQRLI